MLSRPRPPWIRALVASSTAVLTFALVFWFAFAQPWVEGVISKRLGHKVAVGRMYPTFARDGFRLVLRDVVVSGRAPFANEPLAYCDRVQVQPGRTLRVDVSGLDLRLWAATSADNVRGVRAGRTTNNPGLRSRRYDGVELTVHSGTISGVVQLPGGQRVAARVGAFRGASLGGGWKAYLSQVSVDLGTRLHAHVGTVEAELTASRDLIVQGQAVSLALPGAVPLLSGVVMEASASSRGWTVSAHTASAPRSFALSASLSADGVAVEASLRDASIAGLSPLLDKLGVSLNKSIASVEVSAQFALGATEVQWQVDGHVAGVGIHHPAVDQVAWRHQFARGRARGSFDWRQGRLSISESELAPLGLPVSLTGWMDVRTEKRGELTLATAGSWDCAQLQSRFAPSVRRSLWGMALTGKLRAAVDLSFDAADLDKLALDIRMPSKCKVTSEPAVVEHALTAIVAGKSQLPDRPDLPVSAMAPGFTPLAQIPEHVRNAFMTAEDARFFLHQGFELQNIRKALVYNLERGRFARGASTITQQVAKNLFLSHERTLARKLTETVLTWRVDTLLPKRRVLELYLNLVELGPGIRGVGAAAQAYFGKLPADLTPLQAAHLASLPPNPRGFARRFREGSVDDGWLARLYDLVGIMGRRGHLSAAQVGAARGARLRLRKI